MQKHSKLFRSCTLLGLTLAAFVTGQVQAQALPSYTITKIDPLGGYNGSSYGYGISPDGQVTGKSTTAIGSLHAFRYANGVLKDLGALGNDSKLEFYNSEGRSINANGQVAGYGATGNYKVPHAFLYSDTFGGMRDLGSLDGSSSYGYGINATGDITGQTSVTFGNVGTLHAFVYRNNTMTDIGTLCCKDYTGNGISVGYAINDNGQVTGSSQVNRIDAAIPGAYHVFLYSGGTMTDLGTLGGSNAAGYAINASGQITGVSHITGDGAQHAFLYSNGTMTDLGTLDGYVHSEGRGINANGDVVGIAKDVTGRATRPFLYRNGVMTDLNALLPAGSGWTLYEAHGINDAGQIVGTGGYGPDGGQTRAFLLNPASGNPCR